jgi:hypothetical protein
MSIGQNDCADVLWFGRWRRHIAAVYLPHRQRGGQHTSDFTNPPFRLRYSSATLDKAPVAFEPGVICGLSSDGQYENYGLRPKRARHCRCVTDSARYRRRPNSRWPVVAQARATGAAVYGSNSLSQDS